jgi:tRNA splicing endonuclease
MSEAAKQVVDKLTEGLLAKFNVTADLMRHEQQGMDPDELRKLIANRPEEPAPVGYEHFEHLREEGA